MTALIAWGEATLIASAVLMLLVLVVRVPVRRSLGPQLGYTLWALPAARLILPPLPGDVFDLAPLAGHATSKMQLLSVGSTSVPASWLGVEMPSLGEALLAIWLVGAICLFAIHAARHVAFCRKLRAGSMALPCIGSIRVLAADVEGPLAFGVFRRFIVVPHAFLQMFNACERDLALAHECAHHTRGDLIANWASLIILAAHWWNPLAWIAIRAFREDQECAADAHVLAAREPSALVQYAQVLAKAAGIGALPACNLNLRSNLRGRLMMLSLNQQSRGRLMVGAAALILVGGTALAATATQSGPSAAASGKQAVTIGVKPDGAGSYALILGRALVAPGASLPDGIILPADFKAPGGCDLKPTAKPFAMAIKGEGKTQTYTVMCASAASAPIRSTLAEGLASLNVMRASVATQSASRAFPETERTHALAAIDRSVREVEATLATLG